MSILIPAKSRAVAWLQLASFVAVCLTIRSSVPTLNATEAGQVLEASNR
jgi:hypothetical protein